MWRETKDRELSEWKLAQLAPDRSLKRTMVKIKKDLSRSWRFELWYMIDM